MAGGFDPGAAVFYLQLNAAADHSDLRRVEHLVEHRFDGVPHLEAKAAAPQLDMFLIVDVREAEEFAVSHLHAAMRIDPDTPSSKAMAAIAAQRAGRPVLFYCSVGVRSSEMALRLQKALKAEGAASINLKGGVFRWASLGLPLENAGGATRQVHGFDSQWAKLAPPPMVLVPEIPAED